MAITLHYGNALAERVGDKHGLTIQELQGLAPAIEASRAGLRARAARGELGFYDLHNGGGAAAESKAVAQYVRDNFDTFVLLGIGGSALGPICVHTALAHPYYNILEKARRGGPRMVFLDNADPEYVGRLGEAFDLKRTFFSVVSKSGSTPETLAQLMVYYQAVRDAVGEAEAARHFCATTDPAKGPLRELAAAKGWKTLPVPANVGGRFSVLCPVGLFPAAVEGIDIDALLAGAAAMAERCAADAVLANPAALYAAIHYLANVRRGKSISVMMPYSSALRDLADWNRQLWAESLGKARGVDGSLVHAGQTPVKALGATDQHSQVQLYAEGPNDKIFTFIGTKQFRSACPIPDSLPSLENLAYLCGHDMGRLLNAELDATEYALAKNGRPSIRITLDSIDAWHLGGMFYLLEEATAISGGLYGIDAFDQPGVEEGKQATAALMGRQSEADQAKRAELAAFNAKGENPCL